MPVRRTTVTVSLALVLIWVPMAGEVLAETHTIDIHDIQGGCTHASSGNDLGGHAMPNYLIIGRRSRTSQGVLRVLERGLSQAGYQVATAVRSFAGLPPRSVAPAAGSPPHAVFPTDARVG